MTGAHGSRRRHSGGAPNGGPTHKRAGFSRRRHGSKTTGVTVPRRSLAWTVPLLVVAVAAVVAGCSHDDAATTTTTTGPTTTSSTTTTVPAGSDEPLPVVWVRQVGGPGDDVISAVTGSGSSVLGAGTTTGLTGILLAPGTSAAFVDQVDAADGRPRATVQSSRPDTATADGIAAAASESAVMTCGTTPATDGAAAGALGGRDVWCAPVGEDAAIGSPNRLGSSADDALVGVAVSPDGQDAYAAGRADGLFEGAREPTGGDLGAGDAVVVRLDPSGAARWARQFGSAAADAATSVATSSDGDAIVGGWTDGPTRGDTSGPVGGRDAWIARMDQSGNQRWMTQFGSTGSDEALAVAAGGDPRQGTETFIAAGVTDASVGTATSRGGRDAMVVGFDASGRTRWSTQIGSSADDQATGVATDGDTVYVSGTTTGKIVGGRQISLTPTARADQDGSTTTSTPSAPTTTTPPTGGGSDGFLAAIDMATGEVRWVAQFGSTGDEQVTGVTVTPSQLVVVSGSTTGQMGSTPPGGGRDGFMVAFLTPSGGGGAARIV